MTLFCPQCGAGSRFEDINITTKTITCRFCGANFSAVELLSDTFGEDAEPEKPKRQQMDFEAPQPGSIKLREEGMTLVIDRRYPLLSALGQVVFGGFWLFVTVTIINLTAGVATNSMMTVNGVRTSTPTPSWIFPLILLAFVGVGVVALLSGIYQLINTQTIRITSDSLDVINHPIPMPGQSINLNALEQAYVKQHVHTSRSKNGHTSTRYTYSVNLIFGNRPAHTTLIKTLPRDCALFIEQTIEDHLKIEDGQVRGEFGKGEWVAH